MFDVSVLSIRKQKREGYPCTFEYADFIVDGQRLYERILNLIPEDSKVTCLGFGPDYFQQSQMEKMLLIGKSDLPKDRRALFICPGCGDLECGSISALVERQNGMVVWRDFGFENTAYPPSNVTPIPDLGPFYFKEQVYMETIRSAYGLGGFHWPQAKSDHNQKAGI